MNPIGRFDDRAADYVKYRPSYPAATIDTILADLGAPHTLTAADIGAGTGISARLVADRGVQVIAVEPGDTMRSAATPHPHVRWVNGTAEATGLGTASVDLVVCAQSFHWFRADDALAEFARILRPAGRLAIMWNRRSATDPFTTGYRDAIAAVGGSAEIDRAPFDPACVTASGHFTPPVRTVTPSDQRLDLAGLIGRAKSTSYAPKSGADGDRLVALLTDLHARYADPQGYVTLVYASEVFVAHRT